MSPTTNWLVRRVIVTIVLSVSAGCAHLTPLEQVRIAEVQWKRSAIQDYGFTLDIYSLMGGAPCAPRGRGPIDVQVRRAQTVKFGTCSADSWLAREFGTIPLMFETIRKSLAERPPRFVVRFNSSLGYPEFIDADYFRLATDGAAQYTVRDFHKLQ